jgi:hypothetical protein
MTLTASTKDLYNHSDGLCKLSHASTMTLTASLRTLTASTNNLASSIIFLTASGITLTASESKAKRTIFAYNLSRTKQKRI